MNIVIISGGRATRSDLATRDLLPYAKRIIKHRFHKIARRDALRVIAEQLEPEPIITLEEQEYRDMLHDSLRESWSRW